MNTLHTFGCSITQGFALPDTVKTIVDHTGTPLTEAELSRQGYHWSDIHMLIPSQSAWPQVLADELGMACVNHARRGACFQQIARQVAQHTPSIQPEDTVIVMWTYLSRLSLQWPARTSVPFAHLPDPNFGWRTAIRGFNNLFGLSKSLNSTIDQDDEIQEYLHNYSVQQLDPKSIYNRYYNNLVLQQNTARALATTNARIIHLSVETQPVLEQLEFARNDLEHSLKHEYSAVPDPLEWYDLNIDYSSVFELLNPDIPPAENDTHPSVTHHYNFAQVIKEGYFEKARSASGRA